jgi:predicted NBD/HSP70 family sugar kinase
LPNAPGFEGISIGEEIAGRLNCPIAVENRATAAALGERLFGCGGRFASFLMVTLGAGVGGGLVIGRQLYPGSNGFGAEIGHISVESGETAPLCNCGQKGCLEAFVGARGVLRTFEAYGGRASDLSAVVASARRGDVAGIMTFEVFARYLGRGLSSIQNLLDLNAIVLSGTLSGCFDIFEQRLRSELRERCFAGLLAEVPLLVSELGETATVIGAAHLTEL